MIETVRLLMTTATTTTTTMTGVGDDDTFVIFLSGFFFFCVERFNNLQQLHFITLSIAFAFACGHFSISSTNIMYLLTELRLNLKDQILTTNVWLEHEWQDHKFKWDPSEYGGVTELYVPSEHIWLPDIVLYNNADGEYVVTTMTKAILHYTGKVVWTPPAIFKSSCEIDVRYFPFDQQTCFMKFGSWTYDGDQIDLKHINQKNDKDNKVELGIDLREYYPSVEWDILGVPAERHEKYYPCCAEPYPDFLNKIYFATSGVIALVSVGNH
uniref:Neurotransmitter-gated ion-channel ligand-binding domain-containing protein n=1 Tax=Glossina brevipalpis TaxID=37001 RepID=A0A1A9X474_9MUSC